MGRVDEGSEEGSEEAERTCTREDGSDTSAEAAYCRKAGFTRRDWAKTAQGKAAAKTNISARGIRGRIGILYYKRVILTFHCAAGALGV